MTRHWSSFLQLKPVITIAIAWACLGFSAQACSEGNTRLSDYMRRDNNRCEGVVRDSQVSGSLRPIALNIIGDTSRPQNFLSIRVPRINNADSSTVRVRSISHRYKLDNLDLTQGLIFNTFNLPTALLQRLKISVSSLRALSFSVIDSQLVYTPVIIGDNRKRYEFVFYSPNPVRFPKVEVRQGEQVVYERSTSVFSRGEISFVWDGMSRQNRQLAQKGRYEIRYLAEIEQRGNYPPDEISHSIVFEHDPDWLQE